VHENATQAGKSCRCNRRCAMEFDTKNRYGWTVSHWATGSKHKTMRLLLGNKADMAERIAESRTQRNNANHGTPAESDPQTVK
jgi:hypothetical protein